MIFAVNAKLRLLLRVDGLRDVHLGVNDCDQGGCRTWLPVQDLHLLSHPVLTHLEELRLELLFPDGLFRALVTDSLNLRAAQPSGRTS